MIDLTGKSIVVTGGGSGIGLGILRQCVAAGANVTVFDVNPDAKETVEAASGQFVLVDVSDADALARVADDLPRCDGLVNNAGITVQKPLAQLDLDEMDQLWTINQRSLLVLTKLLTSKLASSGNGAIVNIASNHAKASAQDYEAYAGTKGAIVAMTRALAWSLGPKNIRVNALAPGLTMTEAVTAIAASEDGLMDTFNSWHATARVNSVDEIGKVAAFLLSDASSAINGSEIVADQGMSARLGGLS
ncbi:SDR family oxidoreductase [Loktanella sp. F6476L]|uniref:SDR family NAD(P)-dependent oxidoreductase n=1 Tax=Loktanella sp. F6476L TaxID=2926405 RepID=UPI001FF6E6D8|nr:SDR family oxidoreductase [Loktanella sp. F6476L]MCK0122209.1 SDR family oxidoreductase [Loktanella sp. F6476L]